MTSPDKAKSNKRNAQQSTGPRTAAGKAKSSSNALSHGILSRDLLLPDEDEGQWAELLAQLMTELQPVGTLEQILVERIAVAAWRQRRLVRVETARIQVGQRPGMLERMRTKDLVGANNDRLVERILVGRFDEDIIPLYAELAAAKDAAVDSLDGLRSEYPRAWQKLLEQAAQSASVVAFLNAKFQGKVTAYIAHMVQQQANILHAYQQARIDKEANSLPAAPELIARYQSALDNDLYKAMRALREAQKFRRESFEIMALQTVAEVK
jgi:hypothetical protein